MHCVRGSGRCSRRRRRRGRCSRRGHLHLVQVGQHHVRGRRGLVVVVVAVVVVVSVGRVRAGGLENHPRAIGIEIRLLLLLLSAASVRPGGSIRRTDGGENSSCFSPSVRPSVRQDDRRQQQL